MKGAEPTIRSVATAAGVSVATVSAVINGTRYVSPKTTKRVREVIERTGYRPNRLARSLSTRRTQTVGIVIPTILSPIAPLLIKSATDVLYEQGFMVLFANTEMRTSWEEQAIGLMFDSQVDGLLVVPAGQQPVGLDRFGQLHRPVVLLMHGVRGGEDFDVIRSGNFKGSLDAVNHLLDRGATRIAVLALPTSTEAEAERLAAYRTAILAAGLNPDPELVRVGEPSESGSSEEHGYAETRKLMRLANPPDAIFAMNQYMAIGCLAALKELGVRVPEDVALVGFDDLVWTRHLEPSLSVVAQQVHLIGQMGADRLLRRLAEENPPGPAESITVDTRLIVRASSDRRR